MRERCHECFNMDSYCTCDRVDDTAKIARLYVEAVAQGIGHPLVLEWKRRAGLRLHGDPSYFARNPNHPDVLDEAMRVIGLKA